MKEKIKENKKKYEKLEIHTKEESFSLISNSKNNYDLYVGEFNLDELGHNKILNTLSQLGKKDTLNINISSCGGNTYLLLQYINILQITKAKVNAYLNFGYSAGALLFGACQNRYVYQYSSLMYHSSSGGFYGKLQEVESQSKCVNSSLYKMMEVFYLGLSKKEFQQLKDNKDFWFNADEIIDRKIAIKYNQKEENDFL